MSSSQLFLAVALLFLPACFMSACGLEPQYPGHGDVTQELPEAPPQRDFGWDFINQGTLGDCGLVASLAALAAYDQDSLTDAVRPWMGVGMTVKLGNDEVNVTMVDVPDSVHA